MHFLYSCVECASITVLILTKLFLLCQLVFVYLIELWFSFLNRDVLGFSKMNVSHQFVFEQSNAFCDYVRSVLTHITNTTGCGGYRWPDVPAAFIEMTTFLSCIFFDPLPKTRMALNMNNTTMYCTIEFWKKLKQGRMLMGHNLQR